MSPRRILERPGHKPKPAKTQKAAKATQPDLDTVRIGRFKKSIQPGQPVYQVTPQEVDHLIHLKNAKNLLQQVYQTTVARSTSHQVRRVGLSEEERSVLLDRLPTEYHHILDAFSKGKATELPPHRTYDHRIVLEKDAVLGHCPLYAMSAEPLGKVKEYLDKMLTQGFIVPSQAPYASPVLFVEKPGGGLRFCVDYQKLNSLTKKNRYPLPLINETLAKADQSKWFTKLDIVAASNNLRMHPDSEDLTTFKTRFGTFKYRVMPFGLCNGPASWRNYMNDILFEHLDKFCSVYLDDILIYSETYEEHVKHVQLILEILKKHGLCVDINKSEFHVQETKYLGFYLGVNGLRADPEKTRAIAEWPRPTSAKQVASFLGFCGFYRRIVPIYSKIA